MLFKSLHSSFDIYFIITSCNIISKMQIWRAVSVWKITSTGFSKVVWFGSLMRKERKKWWMNFKTWKCMTCLFLLQVTLFDTPQKKIHSKYIIQNTDIFRTFRFSWWKNVYRSSFVKKAFIERHKCIDAVNASVKYILLANTKYFYGFTKCFKYIYNTCVYFTRQLCFSLFIILFLRLTK